jgi:hypothetical protein
MKRLVLVAGVVCGLLAVGAMAAEEAIEPKETIVLFNGKDLTGWKIYLRGKNVEPDKVFSVANGVVRCAGRPPGYMRTEKDYRNYRFVMEWRFTKPGNSGVLVHMSEPDRVWPKSIECQGMFRNQGDFWLIGGTECKEHKGMKGRRVPKRGEHNEKPVGEWNVYEVVCDGDTVRPYVNGKLMNEGTECSVTSGKICIQSEGGVWEARKIVLEPLKK